MSRIGRLPVEIPGGVQVNVNGSHVQVKGPKGELQRSFSPLIGIALENNQLLITRNSDNPAERALHGTTRAVLSNMVNGVSKPGRRIYTKKTDIPWVLSGIGVAILSTPKGVMTGARARQLGVGGEILCKVW